MKKIVVVNKIEDWKFDTSNIDVVSAKEYISQEQYMSEKRIRVFNLCHRYSYQSVGYYVSLLAEARGQRVYPTITTIQDLKSPTILRTLSSDADLLIQKSLESVDQESSVLLFIVFGLHDDKKYTKLAKELYALFPSPFLKVQFVFSKRANRWVVQDISSVSIREIPEEKIVFAGEAVQTFLSRERTQHPRPATGYDVAILINPQEKEPPSDKSALDNFAEAARSVGMIPAFITSEDYGRITEFDGLFIRETTAVNHHTYRFARRAEAEHIPVIDDPLSIVRCTNKVYLAELLMRNNISAPKTMIVSAQNAEKIIETIGLPCILKAPDSAFSMGVKKAETETELKTLLSELLKSSELIIVQEYIKTEFDWRIGVLDREPLFACKYYMARGHWQIYDWNVSSGENYGDHETMELSMVPEHILKNALKAANCIGSGFYGVDIKEHGTKGIVIEVNDNPSIDAGFEDEVLGAQLYRAVMLSLKGRIERSQGLPLQGLK